MRLYRRHRETCIHYSQSYGTAYDRELSKKKKEDKVEEYKITKLSGQITELTPTL